MEGNRYELIWAELMSKVASECFYIHYYSGDNEPYRATNNEKVELLCEMVRLYCTSVNEAFDFSIITEDFVKHLKNIAKENGNANE